MIIFYAAEADIVLNFQQKIILVQFSSIKKCTPNSEINNFLFSLRFEEIPIVLCSLASLRFLDMSNNSLHSVPPEISQLSSTLTTLLLIMNEIEFLPDSFAQLTSLTCLWLGK